MEVLPTDRGHPVEDLHVGVRRLHGTPSASVRTTASASSRGADDGAEAVARRSAAADAAPARRLRRTPCRSRGLPQPARGESGRLARRCAAAAACGGRVHDTPGGSSSRRPAAPGELRGGPARQRPQACDDVRLPSRAMSRSARGHGCLGQRALPRRRSSDLPRSAAGGSWASGEATVLCRLAQPQLRRRVRVPFGRTLPRSDMTGALGRWLSRLRLRRPASAPPGVGARASRSPRRKPPPSPLAGR